MVVIVVTVVIVVMVVMVIVLGVECHCIAVWRTVSIVPSVMLVCYAGVLVLL